MADDFSHEPIARDDVPLHNLSKTVEVVVADDEPASNGCSRLLLLLKDVNVHEVLLPEFPSQCDAVLASGRWPEQVVSIFALAELGYCPSRADIFELLVCYPPWDESTNLFWPQVH